jgi:tetratricopeptide (TPR) repeat protein
MPIKGEKDLAAGNADLWKRASSAISASNLDYAISLLQNLLKAEPAFLEGRKRLRVAEIQRFKAQSSMSKGTVGLKTGPIIMKAGGSLKKAPAEAMALAEEALAFDPYSPKANEILSQAAEALDLPEIGALAWETVCEGKPDDKEGYRYLAAFYLKLKDWTKAQGAFERLLRIDPRDGDAQSGLKNVTAQMATAAGGWEKGGDFRQSLRDKDQSASLEMANKVVKSDEAIHQQILLLNEKVSAEPGNMTWPKQIAALYAQLQDFDNAVAWYQYVYDAGNQIDNSIEKTIGELKLKKLDKDISAYRDAAEQDPATYQEHHDNLVLQRKQVVLEMAQQRVARYPTEYEFHYQLGKAYCEIEQYKEALQPLQQGMKAPSVRLEAMNLMGISYWKRNMLDFAEKRFTEAVGEIPVMTDLKKEIIYNLGCVLIEGGKKEAALDQFKLIYEMDMAYKDVAQRVEDSYNS